MPPMYVATGVELTPGRRDAGASHKKHQGTKEGKMHYVFDDSRPPRPPPEGATSTKKQLAHSRTSYTRKLQDSFHAAQLPVPSDPNDDDIKICPFEAKYLKDVARTIASLWETSNSIALALGVPAIEFVQHAEKACLSALESGNNLSVLAIHKTIGLVGFYLLTIHEHDQGSYARHEKSIRQQSDIHKVRAWNIFLRMMDEEAHQLVDTLKRKSGLSNVVVVYSDLMGVTPSFHGRNIGQRMMSVAFQKMMAMDKDFAIYGVVTHASAANIGPGSMFPLDSSIPCGWTQNEEHQRTTHHGKTNSVEWWYHPETVLGRLRLAARVSINMPSYNHLHPRFDRLANPPTVQLCSFLKPRKQLLASLSQTPHSSLLETSKL